MKCWSCGRRTLPRAEDHIVPGMYYVVLTGTFYCEHCEVTWD